MTPTIQVSVNCELENKISLKEKQFKFNQQSSLSVNIIPSPLPRLLSSLAMGVGERSERGGLAPQLF